MANGTRWSIALIGISSLLAAIIFAVGFVRNNVGLAMFLLPVGLALVLVVVLFSGVTVMVNRMVYGPAKKPLAQPARDAASSDSKASL